MNKKMLFGITVVSYLIILFALVFMKEHIRAVNHIPFGFVND